MQGERLGQAETGAAGPGCADRPAARNRPEGAGREGPAQDGGGRHPAGGQRRGPLPPSTVAGVLHRHRPPRLHSRADQQLAADLLAPGRWWERSGWEESAVLLAGLYPGRLHPGHPLAQGRAAGGGRPMHPGERRRAGGPTTPVPGAARRLAAASHRHRAGARPRGPRRRRPRPGPVGARRSPGRRPGCQTALPDIDWVAIRGGEFIYQDEERRRCESFRIGRYPITHAQFQAFLEAADGYADDRWWADLDDPEREPAPARWPIANHPREMVSWFEAMAFCAWLSHRLGLDDPAAHRMGMGAGRARHRRPRLPVGQRVPSRVTPTSTRPMTARDRTTWPRPAPWASIRRAPRPRACWTSPATSGNGASTNTTTRSMLRRERLRALAWCAAAPGGLSGLRARGLPRLRTIRTPRTTASVFVWCARPPSADHWCAGHWTLIFCPLNRAQRGYAIFSRGSRLPRTRRLTKQTG